MAPPKKMSLQEFFTDESFGGSWADDDIDIASISVPIEKHKHYSGYDFHSNGGDHFGGPMRGGGGGGYANGMDNGPPYIIKLLNLPVTSDDSFVEDLFKSRYTPYVKFKIVVDPISNILETRVIKRVAFVELNSFQDLQKAIKWTDLYYKDRRRVVIEKADFRDFQNCMQFNQQHEREIQEITDDFVNQKNQPFNHRNGSIGAGGPGSPERFHSNVVRQHQSGPLNPHSQLHAHQPILGSTPGHSHPHHLPHELPPLQPPKPADPPRKFNPFGAAKPVDVVAKSHEIDKKLVIVNQTTIKTMGDDTKPQDKNRRSSTSSAKSSKKTGEDEIAIPTPKKAEVPVRPPAIEAATKPKYSPAPVPVSAYGQDGKSGFSLAEMLSSKHTDSTSGRSSPAKSATPKTPVSKPIILKKKIVTTPAPEGGSTEITEVLVPTDSIVDTKTDEDKPISVSQEDESNKKSDVEVKKKASSGSSPISNTDSVKSLDRAEKFEKLTKTEPTSKTKDELASILQRNKERKSQQQSRHKNYEPTGRRLSDANSHTHSGPHTHQSSSNTNTSSHQNHHGQPFASRGSFRRSSEDGSIKPSEDSSKAVDPTDSGNRGANGARSSSRGRVRGSGRGGGRRGSRGGRGSYGSDLEDKDQYDSKQGNSTVKEDKDQKVPKDSAVENVRNKDSQRKSHKSAPREQGERKDESEKPERTERGERGEKGERGERAEKSDSSKPNKEPRRNRNSQDAKPHANNSHKERESEKGAPTKPVAVGDGKTEANSSSKDNIATDDDGSKRGGRGRGSSRGSRGAVRGKSGARGAARGGRGGRGGRGRGSNEGGSDSAPQPAPAA